MAVFCAKCGEELLGAINRCWRCGTEYESRSGRVDVPPIRRPPISELTVGGEQGAGLADAGLPDEGPRSGALEAVVLDHVVDHGHAAADEHDESVVDRGSATHMPAMRRGSPFRADDSGLSDREPRLGDAPRSVAYPKSLGASVGPPVAIALGLVGLGLAYPIPWAGMIIAGCGLGLGIWGLYSKKKKAAILGMLLCCTAIACSGFFAAAEIYRAIHGVAPWESPTYPAP